VKFSPLDFAALQINIARQGDPGAACVAWRVLALQDFLRGGLPVRC